MNADRNDSSRSGDSARGDGARHDEANLVEDVIHRRTSSLAVDPELAVDDATIARLLEAAQAAPNHKATRPLRIAVVRGEARHRLGEAVADAMAAREEAPERVAKTRSKYLRAPVVIVAASTEGASAHETEENRYAVAAGIQNMLLLAEALGLGCLWSSPAKGAHGAIALACGLDDGVHVVGLVYAGWPLRPTSRKDRSAPAVVWAD